MPVSNDWENPAIQGRNRLPAHAAPDGTYLENQDMRRLSGLFRNVYL